MKRLAIAIAIAGIIGTPAFAADMAVKAPPPAPPPAPVYNWTGWYVGVNGGGAWRTKESTLTVFNNDDGLVTTGSGNIDPDGGFGGGQIGYNWQIAPQWVVGLEADIQGGRIQDSANAASLNPQEPGGPDHGPLSGYAKDQLDWFGSVRVRAGYTFFDRVLSYVTGGVAFGRVSDTLSASEQSENDPLLFGSVSSNKTKTGWIVGWGTEGYITPQLTLRAESDYMSLGSSTLATGTITAPDEHNDFPSATANLNHKYWLFRVGLNYKFSGW